MRCQLGRATMSRMNRWAIVIPCLLKRGTCRPGLSTRRFLMQMRIPAGGFSEPSQNNGHTPIDPALRDTVPINKQQPHNAALPGLYPNDNPPIFNSAVWNQNNSFTFNYMNNTPSKGRAVKGLGSLASMDKRRFTQKPKTSRLLRLPRESRPGEVFGI